MNPARWTGLGKLLGRWPGDGDGLVYNDEGGARGYDDNGRWPTNP